MNIPTALLIAYSIFDFVPKPAELLPVPSTFYSEQGQGQLLVDMIPANTIGSIPRGATRVFVGVMNLSASCEKDITVSSVTLAHTGLGNIKDIRSVYAGDDARRISRGARFDTQSRLATLQFPLLVIPKCDVTSIRLFIDLQSDASVGSEHGVEITSSSLISSSAKEVTVTSIDTTSKAFVTPYKQGTISVNFLPIRGPFQYGRLETVARIQLSADAVANHVLQKITLTNEDLARDMDLTYFRIETTRGELLSGPATRMQGKKVTIPFSPSYELSSRSTVVLLVKAEVRAPRKRGVLFTLEEPSDLVSIPGHSR